MPEKMQRIGVSMREVTAAGHGEVRDALARDWGPYLAAALPRAAWLPVPNLGGPATVEFFRRWKLNGLILTGGDDLGVTPARDASEKALLAHAVAKGIPALGVCRGLQLMWLEWGGKLSPVEGHRAARHPLREGKKTREVNSFHSWGLDGAAKLKTRPASVFARAADGTMEGVDFFGATVRGVMWHPEREPRPSPQDVRLFRQTFGASR